MSAWAKNRNTLEGGELVAVAFQGLVSAAIRFDPTRPDINPDDLVSGTAFAGFARIRINGAIKDWQRSRDHVPRRQRRMYLDLKEQGHGAGKTPEQLADLTGLDVEKIRAITRAVEATSFSLDAPSDSWDADTPPDSVDRHITVDVESVAFVSSIQVLMVNTLHELPLLQQNVLVLRYYLGLEFPVIAQELEERLSSVRSAHNEAIQVIHEEMKRAAA